jgi:hypothetical protein
MMEHSSFIRLYYSTHNIIFNGLFLHHPSLDEVTHIEKDILVFDDAGALCTTQDTFQQQPEYEVNDMEAYGIAKVCRIFGFDFTAYKFISDSGDGSDWEENHHLGIEQYLDILNTTWLNSIR